MALVGETRADDLDERLHAERLGPRREEAADELPHGTFVLVEGEPWLVLGDKILRWTPGGYAELRARPRAGVTVITPATTLDVLRAGWAGAVPFLHPSSRS